MPISFKICCRFFPRKTIQIHTNRKSKTKTTKWIARSVSPDLLEPCQNRNKLHVLWVFFLNIRTPQLLAILILKLQQRIFYNLLKCPRTDGSAASDLGLHCLLRLSDYLDKYANTTARGAEKFTRQKAEIQKAECRAYRQCVALRKHAYSNILKILPPKNENFQINIQIFFIFLLKT